MEEGPPLGEREARGVVLAGTLDPKLLTTFVNKGLDEAFCQLEVGAQGDVAVSPIRMIRKSLSIWQRSPQNEETRRARSSGETPLPSVMARKSSRSSPGRRLGSACSRRNTAPSRDGSTTSQAASAAKSNPGEARGPTSPRKSKTGPSTRRGARRSNPAKAGGGGGGGVVRPVYHLWTLTTSPPRFLTRKSFGPINGISGRNRSL